ncbi:MAG TPA: serine/threonine-protein kinase [Bryobacteraceae bacterium]|jgi:serine/threonine-protein kinase|nr:serine/threonine-protein kinase [Bryobacteraceae bacterium]
MPDTLTQIGRYEISRHLVDTALASVYDAFDPVERKPVAILVPRASRSSSIEPALGLKHPGLMTVLSYEQNQGEPFAVLEPFQGTPLDTIVHAGNKMEPAEAIGLLRQLASVLDYAHAHGSVHGSLHPSSVLLNDRHEIKVLDLGAPAVGRNASAEQLLQAIHYLSPECVRDLPMEGRADQFSLAVLAHRMLTGELPYAGKPLGVMFRIAYQGLERDAMRELPPAAQTVLARALSKKPAGRYATCGEMVESLSAGLFRAAPAATRIASAAEFAAVPPPAPPLVLPPAAPGGFFSREGFKYFGITFLVCALVLGAVLYILLPKAPKPIPVLPAAGQAIAPPPAAPAATRPAPTAPAVEAKGKSVPKAVHAKKKEQEIDVKPAEPKIIR